MGAGDFLRDKLSMLMVCAGLFSAIMYVALFFMGAGEEWASDVSWIPYLLPLVLSIAVLALVVRFYGVGTFEGKVWALIFMGLVLWAVAELITGTDVLLGILGAGSLLAVIGDNADYPFLAGYVLMAAGFLYKAANTPVKSDTGKAFIVLSLAGIFAMASVFLVIHPTMASSAYSGQEKFFMVAYIVLDVMLFGIALAIALYWGAAVSRGWYIIAAGLLSMMVADMGYAALDLNGIYFDGSLIELAWVFAYLLMGAAGHYQRKLHESFT